MKKALLVIDYTVDFVADHGALTCGKPAQVLESRISQLTEEFISAGEYVVFAVDVHQANDAYHPETSLFPIHNVRDSAGRELYGNLAALAQTYLDHPQVYYMDKTRYSAFAGTDLDLRLRARGIDEIHLTGVCTDICVLHTAVDGYNKGYRLVIHSDAVQSFDPEGHRWSLRHFENTLGARVTAKEEKEKGLS